MIDINVIALFCCPSEHRRIREFIGTLIDNGVCFVNYVLGATYRYTLDDCYIKDENGYTIGTIHDDETQLLDRIDLQGVSSITPINIR